MKYLKHFYVDPVTGEAVTTSSLPQNGKTHPAVPGLDVKFWFSDNGVDFCLSVTDEDDEVSLPGVSYLSESSWFDAAQAEFAKLQEARTHEVFVKTIGIKSNIVDAWWHPTEISAGVSMKVIQAKAAMEEDDDYGASLVAPIVALEAQTRNMSVKELAQRIIDNYESLVAAEAIISGHRGLLTDSIAAMVFDRTSIETAIESFNTLNSFNTMSGFDTILSQLNM